MSNMIKTIYKISISIICAILTSCVSTEVKIMGTLAGTVKDVNTNYPIKNCLVVNDVTSASLRTDANGYFNFGEVEYPNAVTASHSTSLLNDERIPSRYNWATSKSTTII